MSVLWELVGYDTDARQARCREYTRSAKLAERWERIPRIDFTDSGHGIVFAAREVGSRRWPVIRRLEHADKFLRDEAGFWRERYEQEKALADGLAAQLQALRDERVPPL